MVFRPRAAERRAAGSPQATRCRRACGVRRTAATAQEVFSTVLRRPLLSINGAFASVVAAVLLAAACQAASGPGEGEPIIAPAPTEAPAAASRPPAARPATPSVAIAPMATSRSADAEAEIQVYGARANRVAATMTDVTRILSFTGLDLFAQPENAVQFRDLVEGAKETLEFIRGEFGPLDPPPALEELRQHLLDALSLYGEAASALLPDAATGEADPQRFQELMLAGGKHSHAAISELLN